MKLRHWNFISAFGLLFIVAGLLVARSYISVGRIFLTIGCAAFVAAIIGSYFHSKKNPMRCPYCGEILVPMGRRYRGGVYHLDILDRIPCPKCGAMVSTNDRVNQQ